METKSSNTEMLSAYGALDDARTKLTVMLINKDPARSAEASLAPQGFTVGSMATQYRYGAVQTDGPDARVVAVTDPKDIAVTVPPMSISLVVLNTGQK